MGTEAEDTGGWGAEVRSVFSLRFPCAVRVHVVVHVIIASMCLARWLRLQGRTLTARLRLLSAELSAARDESAVLRRELHNSQDEVCRRWHCLLPLLAGRIVSLGLAAVVWVDQVQALRSQKTGLQHSLDELRKKVCVFFQMPNRRPAVFPLACQSL